MLRNIESMVLGSIPRYLIYYDCINSLLLWNCYCFVSKLLTVLKYFHYISLLKIDQSLKNKIFIPYLLWLDKGNWHERQAYIINEYFVDFVLTWKTSDWQDKEYQVTTGILPFKNLTLIQDWQPNKHCTNIF